MAKTKTKQTSPPPSPQTIFVFAESFAQAADILQKEQFRSKPPGKYAPFDASHLAPAATLDSFALELYLKCLYVIDFGRKPPPIHDTKKLFSYLLVGTRDSILYHYTQVLLANPEIAEDLRKKHPQYHPFNKGLKATAEVFERVRYLYEGHKYKFFYWPLIRLAVRSTIISIKPRWKK